MATEWLPVGCTFGELMVKIFDGGMQLRVLRM
jgi:hypothetical protein